MKKFFYFVLVLMVPSFFYGVNSSKQTSRPISSTEPSTVLLSYERSGSHWLSYCLYRLAIHHVIDYNEVCNDVSNFIPKLPVNTKATRPFCRAHTIQGGADVYAHLHRNSPHYGVKISKEKDILLLLLRDYKECYPRQRPNEPLLLMPQKEPHYFENLELYHNWPAERRYLVYYEDLTQNIEETLKDLLTFLQEPVDGVPQFLANLEDHKQLVLHAYDKRWGAQSKGDDIHYHAKKIDSELLRQLDELVIARYPHLVPYLERYLAK